MIWRCGQWGVLVAVALLSGSVRASGPCDFPPFDPLTPIASAVEARAMDGWAIKALRRDMRGKTCGDIQEVVDVLLVRWLQAHPDIAVAFEGEQASRLLSDPGAFMVTLKAEAWTEIKGRRKWCPRSWGPGGTDANPRAMERRTRFLERSLHRLARAQKK